MLTLLCTAPSSMVVSPVEGSLLPPPPASAGPSSSSSSSSSSNSNSSPAASSNGGGIGGIGRKLSIRRPSIRKRIPSLSRASGTSIDSAAGGGGGNGKSPFSFFRNTSASSAGSSCGHANAAASGSASVHVHARGGILNIGALKHQLHVGLEYTDDRDRDRDARDETRSRQDEDDSDDMVIIDLVPPNTSSERYGVSHAHSRSASVSAIASSPSLLSLAGVATITSTSNPSSSSTVGISETPKQQKRASLVKRKPVPKIDLEDLVESPPRAVSPVSLNPTFVLVPDPVPAPSRDGEKGVQGGAEVASVSASAPPGKMYFDVPNPNPKVQIEKAVPKVVEISIVKEKEVPEDAKPNALVPPAPEHIRIFHAVQFGPAPTPPPRRRHTLAHMQARALGLGRARTVMAPSGPRPLCGAERLQVPARDVERTAEKNDGEERKEREKAMEKEKKTTRQRPKPTTRPVPIVAPSPSPSPSPAMQIPAAPSPSPVAAFVPPGLDREEKRRESALEETKRTDSDSTPEQPRVSSTITVVSAGNSPRPSLSSLAPSSESDGSARSSSSTAESGDMDTEPRTPTDADERRVSSSSAAYVKSSRIRNNGVRIVLPGEFPVSETEDDEERNVEVEELETPRILRRTSTASKRLNPPARRVRAKEESVYVTADEADDVCINEASDILT